MVHYEYLILYGVGFKPKELIRKFNASRSGAYRMHRIYREARKRAIEIIMSEDYVSPEREKKPNKLGEANGILPPHARRDKRDTGPTEYYDLSQKQNKA